MIVLEAACYSLSLFQFYIKFLFPLLQFFVLSCKQINRFLQGNDFALLEYLLHPITSFSAETLLIKTVLTGIETD